MNAAHPYIATIQQVQEVTLAGTADAPFWTDRLQREALVPNEGADGVEVIVSATILAWMGIRFRELIVSVAVADPNDRSKHVGFYLVSAFNTSALLAFMERTVFHTPYHHATIEVKPRLPAAISVQTKVGRAFHARMSERAAYASRGMELWEGPIYLPEHSSKRRRVFFVQLGGITETYPFMPDQDTLDLDPTQHPAIQSLVASRFTGKVWRLRQSATHARSKTYRRPT